MTTIEKVARALCKAAGTDPDVMMHYGVPFIVWGGYIPSGEPYPAWMQYAGSARMAIAALREPTFEMVCAGDSHDPGMGSLSGRIWSAMIDAALAEAPE